MNGSTTSAMVMHRITRVLQKNRRMIRLSLQACAHCALCSESCFKYTNSGRDPRFSPSYKAINSIGTIYRKKGRLSDSEYHDVSALVWERCALCMRCYCPVGISIPSLIACARSICRERGIFPA
ncbi:MAG TPA: (Fe-S)-binding protein [Spirochaetia bacterium]|nr:(Fe-S)-binding protein [Spirochaetia bacterium]